MKRRDLTPEEQELWDYVTRGDVPLPRDNTMVAKRQSPIAKKIVPQAVPFAMPPMADDRRLVTGDYAGIDRNTATRFRKGKYPLVATLDLHGMNREKAYNSLRFFIQNHYEQGTRCVLVVTGKGGQQKANNGDEAPKGVLRESLPQWLGAPDIKPLILAFDTARPQHGGGGAF